MSCHVVLDAIVIARHIQTKNSLFTILQYSGFMASKQTTFLVAPYHAKEAILWNDYMKNAHDSVV